MLNPFPIQFLALFAYFILRIVVGLVFLSLGFKHFKNRHALYPIFPFGKILVFKLIVIELVVGSLFFLGLFTQIAALIAIMLSFKMIMFGRRFNHYLIPNRQTYFLILGISLTLFITGAGVFAFDLPI